MSIENPAVNSLSSYQQQPEVQARFQQIYQRPVVLKAEHLHKYYVSNGQKKLALKDINIDIHRREFICVIGPSGCGKSTFSRIIAGLEPYDQGVVLVDGEKVEGPCRNRGMVFQGYTLFPWRTVKENVMFGPQMNGATRDGAEKAALQWLDLIGLEQYADAYPDQLSGGMKQRVAIARALVNEPRILLMDEPFGALDPHTRQKMQQHLLDIWKNIDITVIFVTHDMDEAILLADRIVVLKANPGELVEIIEVPVARPRHPNQMLSAEFMAVKKHINQLVHGDEEELEPSLENLPHIPLMTRVDDTVE
jgi:NitT/TauT family transport system ATP-binding protein